MAIDQPLKSDTEFVPLQRKRGRPAGAGSQSVKSKMEQKMALVNQRLALLDSSSSSSSSENDKDDNFVPMVRPCVKWFNIDFRVASCHSSY
ncbi:B3 domain-containing protein Os01g0234100-like [Phragmites australis]|uniref:B3 domain-containing protein Os01g0234100-like n=1 Tax=Phragmites australis TaxID=29695 RepID=UPI002D79944E|nr:B3 domain-containing protein Os01g0234100-like [Phragmites australis]